VEGIFFFLVFEALCMRYVLSSNEPPNKDGFQGLEDFVPKGGRRRKQSGMGALSSGRDAVPRESVVFETTYALPYAEVLFTHRCYF
jgi:hypothetical protein